MIQIEINNIQGRILTMLNIEQLSVISSECSFQVEGSEYKVNAFKRKSRGQCQWDGYRRLFNQQTQTFPIGLLTRITHLLRICGIEYEIIDKRTHMDMQYNWECKPREIRQYQRNAVIACILNESGILQSATGSGKTTMAGMIMAMLGEPTVFIVHTKDLLYQAKESFEKLLNIEIGQIGDGIVDLQPITVATVQSLSRASTKIELENYKYDEDGGETDDGDISNPQRDKIRKWAHGVGLVLFDEVQRVASRTAFSARFMFDNADHAYGLSASPWRDDGADLMIEGAFGPIIHTITATELIYDNYLIRPDIIIKKVNNNIWSGKDYATVYRTAIVENVMRNTQICQDAIEQYKMGKCTLILVTQVKHGKTLQKMIDNTGIPVQFISGKSNSKYRKQVIEDMREGKAPLVIATTIADVGLDVPRIEAIIEGGAGKSSVTALQRVGRAIRKFNNKDHATYITYRDNAPYLNQQIDNKIAIWRTEPAFNIIEEE